MGCIGAVTYYNIQSVIITARVILNVEVKIQVIKQNKKFVNKNKSVSPEKTLGF